VARKPSVESYAVPPFLLLFWPITAAVFAAGLHSTQQTSSGTRDLHFAAADFYPFKWIRRARGPILV